MRSMIEFSKGSLRLSTMFVVFLFPILALSLIGTRTLAVENGGMCIPVHAKIQSTFFAEGCYSPAGLCTTGEITEGGILNGTTDGALHVATAPLSINKTTSSSRYVIHN